MDRIRTVAVFLAVLAAGTALADPPQADLKALIDCRYLTTENPDLAFDRNAPGDAWFPEGNLFRPLMADVHYPRFYASAARVRFRNDTFPTGSADDTIWAGITGIGIDFGLWRRSAHVRCNGVQIGVTAVMASQFNLDVDSDALINTDFLVGPTVTLRRGDFSSRIALLHQSSHLGDEFLLQNPGIDRINLSFEMLHALFSYDHRWWRTYAGVGYLVGAQPELDPGIVQLGFEARSPRRFLSTNLTPVFAVDFDTLQERNWSVTTSVAAGIEMSNAPGTRRYRVQGVYLAGYTPFGQFFNVSKVESVGLQLQFEY